MRTVKQKTPQSTIEIPILVRLIGVNKEEAEDIKKQLEEAGAKVKLS